MVKPIDGGSVINGATPSTYISCLLFRGQPQLQLSPPATTRSTCSRSTPTCWPVLAWPGGLASTPAAWPPGSTDMSVDTAPRWIPRALQSVYGLFTNGVSQKRGGSKPHPTLVSKCQHWPDPPPPSFLCQHLSAFT